MDSLLLQCFDSTIVVAQWDIIDLKSSLSFYPWLKYFPQIIFRSAFTVSFFSFVVILSFLVFSINSCCTVPIIVCTQKVRGTCVNSHCDGNWIFQHWMVWDNFEHHFKNRFSSSKVTMEEWSRLVVPTWIL